MIPTDDEVERVAQAIADAEWDNQPPFAMKPKIWGDNYRQIARAAIAVMSPRGVEGLVEAPEQVRLARDTMHGPNMNDTMEGLFEALAAYRAQATEPALIAEDVSHLTAAERAYGEAPALGSLTAKDVGETPCPGFPAGSALTSKEDVARTLSRFRLLEEAYQPGRYALADGVDHVYHDIEGSTHTLYADILTAIEALEALLITTPNTVLISATARYKASLGPSLDELLGIVDSP